MHRTKILDEAKKLTTGERQASYGPPYKNHADIAAGWSIILGKTVTPAEVALCMAWLKIARTVKDPKLVDSYVDGAAYMALAGELVDGEPAKTVVAGAGGHTPVKDITVKTIVNGTAAYSNGSIVYTPAANFLEEE